MCPQQATAEKEITARSDVYSKLIVLLNVMMKLGRQSRAAREQENSCNFHAWNQMSGPPVATRVPPVWAG